MAYKIPCPPPLQECADLLKEREGLDAGTEKVFLIKLQRVVAAGLEAMRQVSLQSAAPRDREEMMGLPRSAFSWPSPNEGASAVGAKTGVYDLTPQVSFEGSSAATSAAHQGSAVGSSHLPQFDDYLDEDCLGPFGAAVLLGSDSDLGGREQGAEGQTSNVAVAERKAANYDLTPQVSIEKAALSSSARSAAAGKSRLRPHAAVAPAPRSLPKPEEYLDEDSLGPFGNAVSLSTSSTPETWVDVSSVLMAAAAQLSKIESDETSAAVASSAGAASMTAVAAEVVSRPNNLAAAAGKQSAIKQTAVGKMGAAAEAGWKMERMMLLKRIDEMESLLKVGIVWNS